MASSMIGDFPSIADYRIEARLGAGANGEVYRAFDERLRRHVAIKVLHRLGTQPAGSGADLREGRTLALLSHPNIVSIHSVATTDDGRTALVMELVDGGSLDVRLSRAGGRFPPEEAVRVATMVCGGLAHAHAAGVVHLDLKPANVLVAGSGVAKVVDFGISRMQQETAERSSLGIRGTPVYMAPEQFDDPRCADPRADIYALGIMLFEMLFGTPPFVSPNPFQLAVLHANAAVEFPAGGPADVPPGLRELLTRLLAKKASARPQSADEALADLGRLSGQSAPLRQHEEPIVEEATLSGPPARRRITALPPLLAVFALALAAAATVHFSKNTGGTVAPEGVGASAIERAPVANPILLQRWKLMSNDGEGVVFVPGRQEIVALARDGFLYTVSLASAKPAFFSGDHPIAAGALACDSRGTTLAIAGFVGEFQTVSARSGDLGVAIRVHGERKVFAARFSPDGSMIATCGADNRVVIVDAVRGEIVKSVAVEARLIPSLAWGKDASTLYAGAEDGRLFVVDPVAGKVSATYSPLPPGQSLGHLQYLPEDHRLFAFSQLGTALFLDAGTGVLIKSFASYENTRAGAYSSAADLVVLGTWDGMIRIFSNRTNAQIFSERAYQEQDGTASERTDVDDIAIDPTGEYAASICSDGSIALWQLPIVRQEAGEPSINPESANEK